MKTTSAELQQHEMPVIETSHLNLSINARHIILYPAIIILMSLVINYCFVLYALPAIPFANLLYATTFFMFGIVHVMVLQKWLANIWHDNFFSGTLYTLIMALLAGMCTWIVRYVGIVQQQQLLIIAAVATKAFLLPYG